jgi:hypothetical protein
MCPCFTPTVPSRAGGSGHRYENSVSSSRPALLIRIRRISRPASHIPHLPFRTYCPPVPRSPHRRRMPDTRMDRTSAPTAPFRTARRAWEAGIGPCRSAPRDQSPTVPPSVRGDAARRGRELRGAERAAPCPTGRSPSWDQSFRKAAVRFRRRRDLAAPARSHLIICRWPCSRHRPTGRQRT